MVDRTPARVAADDAHALHLQLAAWLARHKQYPRAARRARIQGTTRVAFVLAGDGRITQGRVVQSSGAHILDRAALQLLRRASPVPGLAQASLPGPIEVRLPITYRLRGARES